jgi:hypothetical protein
MRLKKEDRTGKSNVKDWWSGEDLINQIRRAMMSGRMLSGVEYQRVKPPQHNPDGSDYSPEQRTAWWHKTLTDGVVRYINEQLKRDLKAALNQRWRFNSAKGVVHSLKASIAFRDKYPQAAQLGSTVQGYTDTKHIRAYRDDEKVPWDSINKTRKIWPINTTAILGALAGLQPALNVAAKEAKEGERLRQIDNRKRSIEYNKANIITRQAAIDAFDVEKNNADRKAIENWLKTMPDCVNYIGTYHASKIKENALRQVNRDLTNHANNISWVKQARNSIAVNEAWLAENGGEEE